MDAAIESGKAAREYLTEANLRLVVAVAKKQQWPRSTAARSHPGRQCRPDPRGREVRLPQGLQVLDLCDMVDQAGDHARNRRPSAHHPHPGAYGRNDQPLMRESRRCSRSGPRPQRRRAGQGDGHPGRKSALDPQNLAGAGFAGTPVGQEEDSQLGDFIEDPVLAPSDAASHQMLREQVEQVLNQLTERERWCCSCALA